MTIKLEEFYYDKQYDCEVILLDGLWGAGKTLFQGAISSLDDLEDATIEEIFEHIVNLQYMNKISDESASFLLSNYIDFSMHKSLLGRCTNMRFSDDTGFKNFTNKIEKLKRLFRSEEKNLKSEVIKNKGLVFMTHMIGCHPYFLFKFLKERLYLIEIMRHPVHIFTHVANYFARFNTTREKTVSFKYENKKIPWCYKDIIEFINLNEENPNNKAVEYIYYCY